MKIPSKKTRSTSTFFFFLALVFSFATILPSFALVKKNHDKEDQASMDHEFDRQFGKHKRYHHFFSKLRKAVIQKDCKTLSEMAGYPLLVTAETSWRNIYDPSVFIQECQSIITDDIYQAVKKQKYEELFAKSSGVMIGRGQLWFGPRCTRPGPHYTCKLWEIKFFTINQFQETQPILTTKTASTMIANKRNKTT